MHTNNERWCLSTASPSFYLLFLALVIVEGSSGCEKPLGMQSGRILDRQLSASSEYSMSTLAKYARLDTTEGFGWCPDQRDNRSSTEPFYDQYLEVNFSEPFRITAIETQGRGNSFQEFLENFRVNYTVSESPWKEAINNQTGNTNFEGAENANRTKRNIFIPNLDADAIRIIPRIYTVNQVCFRLELYGCKLDNQGSIGSQARSGPNTTTPTTTTAVTKPSPSRMRLVLPVSGTIILVLLIVIVGLVWKLRRNRASHSNPMQRGPSGAERSTLSQNTEGIQYVRELSDVYMELKFTEVSPYQWLDSLIDPPTAVPIDDDLDSEGYLNVV